MPVHWPQCLQAPTRIVLRVRVLSRGLRGGRQLHQLEVVLPLFPHPVGVGAARVPLDPDPPVFSQFANHTAKARRRSILEARKRPVRGVCPRCHTDPACESGRVTVQTAPKPPARCSQSPSTERQDRLAHAPLPRGEWGSVVSISNPPRPRRRPVQWPLSGYWGAPAVAGHGFLRCLCRHYLEERLRKPTYKIVNTVLS